MLKTIMNYESFELSEFEDNYLIPDSIIYSTESSLIKLFESNNEKIDIIQLKDKNNNENLIKNNEKNSLKNSENIIDNNNETLIINNNNENIKNIIQRKRKTKQKEDIPRNDNIYKQLKIQAIKFTINTLNLLLDNSIYVFQNVIKKEIKDKIQKNFNITLLNESIENLFTEKKYCENENNNKIIEYYKRQINGKKSELINIFLKKKFIEMIKIFGMDKNEFKKQYGFENEYLLENITIKNKDYLKNLIDFGVNEFLEKKCGRNKTRKK